jgi:hypothetical protein
MAETSAQFFPEASPKQASTEQGINTVSQDVNRSYSATDNGEILERNRQGSVDKVVFNDGTAAGVLSNLKGCTRTMHLHEADVTLKTLGLMLPSPSDMTPCKVDPFRSTLMTLHEKPGRFLRVLKKEKIDVTGSKLNIFVCISMVTSISRVAYPRERLRVIWFLPS